MNRLGASTSPYLRQHADNPVHWQEWSEEALAEAVGVSRQAVAKWEQGISVPAIGNVVALARA